VHECAGTEFKYTDHIDMTDTRSSIKQDTLKDLESYLRFRRALRRQDQLVLDNLYQKASLHFAAAQSVDHALPFEILLLSMLLEEHKEVERLRQQVEEVLQEWKL
jgi:hypothetical protein